MIPGDTADYTELSDYICSPRTDAQGKTTVHFAIANLAPSEDVKISVQGIFRPTPLSMDPLDFLRLSLSEYQPIRREGAAVGLIVR